MRRVDSWTGAQLVGWKGGDYAGIAIPYFAPGDRHVREYRLRRNHPDLEADSGGQLKVKQKYLSPPSRSNMLYLPPGCGSALLGNAELPLIITEGEFKTLALWRLATFGVQNDPRFLPVGISGVFNWRGTGATTAKQRRNVTKTSLQGLADLFQMENLSESGHVYSTMAGSERAQNGIRE